MSVAKVCLARVTALSQKVWKTRMVIRSWRRCASWLLFSSAFVLGLVGCEKHECVAELHFAIGIIVLFGLQGFAAEMLGLRADEAGFSFPRRLFPRFGFPVLWRRRITAKRVSRIDSFVSRTVRLHLTSCELVDFVFPDDEKMKRFMRFAKRAYVEPNYIRPSTTKKSV